MPLYYFIDDKKFLFSSEVSAITKSLKEKMDLNLDQVARIILHYHINYITQKIQHYLRE